MKIKKIAIIGLGYVGLPLAVELSKYYKVLGFDINANRIKKLNSGLDHTNEVSSKNLKKAIKNGLEITNNKLNLSNYNIFIVTVPTPVTKSNKPDFKPLLNACKILGKKIKRGTVIAFESTVYPGATQDICGKEIEKYSGLQMEKDFFLGYSPEREDPNNKKFNITNIPKLCSGYSKNCLNLTDKLYQKIVKKTVKLSNIETAEFTKIFENTFRSINIALVNELKLLSTKTKPFGFMAFEPGPGVGGHCIPVDPYYLDWVAKKNNIKMSFIGLAGKINDYMPEWIIKKSINKKTIKHALIIGAAYKKNIDDMRESPALKFFEILEKKKIKVEYHDPFIPILKSRNLKKKYRSVSLKKIKKYDIIYLLTDHDNLDFNYIRKNSKFIIDTRNIYKENFNNVLKL